MFSQLVSSSLLQLDETVKTIIYYSIFTIYSLTIWFDFVLNIYSTYFLPVVDLSTIFQPLKRTESYRNMSDKQCYHKQASVMKVLQPF